MNFRNLFIAAALLCGVWLLKVVPRRLQVADAYLQDRQVDPALLDLRVRCR